MSIPGFTAETSLYRTEAGYLAIPRSAAGLTGRVVPQFFCVCDRDLFCCCCTGTRGSGKQGQCMCG